MIFSGSNLSLRDNGVDGGGRQSLRGFRRINTLPNLSRQSSNWPEIITYDAENPTYVTPFGSYTGRPASPGNLALFMPAFIADGAGARTWRPYASSSFESVRQFGQGLWLHRQRYKAVPVYRLLDGPSFVLPNTLLGQPLPKRTGFLGTAR